MTALITERDHDSSYDLESLIIGQDDHDIRYEFVRDKITNWLATDGERPVYTPYYFNSDPAGMDKVPPDVIAKAIYQGTYGHLPVYYTQLYEDFPLLVAAELCKKIKWYNNQTLRPKYLVEVIRIYTYLTEMHYGRSNWVSNALRFYGPLAINMAGIYKHTSLSIDLVNLYPKLMDGNSMPDSISLYMKCVNRWHMDGKEQSLSMKEVSDNISDEWKRTLLDNAPILRASWESTTNFEQV